MALAGMLLISRIRTSGSVPGHVEQFNVLKTDVDLIIFCWTGSCLLVEQVCVHDVCANRQSGIALAMHASSSLVRKPNLFQCFNAAGVL